MDEWPTMNFYTHPPSLKQQKVKHTHNFHSERESGFHFFFQSVHKRSRLLRKQKLSDTVGTDGDFSLFFVLLIILPNLQDFTRPFFLFLFFSKMARERGGVFERGTRPHFSRCRNLFPSCFPFSSFYTSRRDERKCVSNVGNKHTDTLYPPPSPFELEPLIIFYLFV